MPQPQPKPTFEDFRVALLYPQRRDALGLTLSDTDAIELINDDAAAADFYDRWTPTRPKKRKPTKAEKVRGLTTMTELGSRKTRFGSLLMIVPVIAITMAVVMFISAAVYAVWINPPQPGTGNLELVQAVFQWLSGDGEALNRIYEKVEYVDCADVVARDAAPLYEADRGYEERLDPNGDGIACDAETGELDAG